MNNEWIKKAACKGKDTNLFFPESESNFKQASEQVRKLKALCSTCPVAKECLHYALKNQENYGIWGGLSARERRKILRKYQEINLDLVSAILDNDGNEI